MSPEQYKNMTYADVLVERERLARRTDRQAIDEIEKRLVRVETRLTFLLIRMGFGPDGRLGMDKSPITQPTQPTKE